MEELNKLTYDLKDVTVQQIKKVNRIQVCFWQLIDYLINRDMNVEGKWCLILITSNGILGHCVGLWKIPIRIEDFHTYFIW